MFLCLIQKSMKKNIFVMLSFFCFSSLSLSSMSHNNLPALEMLLEAFSALDLKTVVLVGQNLVEEGREIFSEQDSFSELVHTFLFEECMKRLSYCFLFLKKNEAGEIEEWIRSEAGKVCKKLGKEYSKSKNELDKEGLKKKLRRNICYHCHQLLYDVD